MSSAQAEPVYSTVSIGRYKIETVKTRAELRALEPQWRQFLTSGVTGSNFFNDPGHISLRLELEPQLTPWILVLRCGGRICCIAPFYLQETRLKIQSSVITLASLPVRMLKCFSGEFIVGFGDDAQQCFQRVFEALWQRRCDFGVVLLENLRLNAPLWRFCQSDSSCSRRFRPFLASSQVDKLHQASLPVTHADYIAQLNPRTRQRLRRQARKLCNDKNTQLEKFTTPKQVQPFLNQLDEIYRDAWQAQLTGYHRRNTEPQHRFLTGMAQCGWFRSYTLTADQQPVAYLLGYQHDGNYYYSEIGYRQQWADYSPGAVLTYLFLEDLFQDNRLKLVDFMVGDQPYKRSLSNLEQAAASIYLAPPNRWRLVLRMQQFLHFVARHAVRALTCLRLDRALRKHFKVQR
jgi:CelD/BcsL family acetyltransferase involved in cellulose biosynthesis